mmetsp:Transcript_16028/g.27626  ORF Transcript_16028/g.27626 Transcript_16028/m.27626 type:complete len:231 (-) Transcript_16028:25-717(-)
MSMVLDGRHKNGFQVKMYQVFQPVLPLGLSEGDAAFLDGAFGSALCKRDSVHRRCLPTFIIRPSRRHKNVFLCFHWFSSCTRERTMLPFRVVRFARVSLQEGLVVQALFSNTCKYTIQIQIVTGDFAAFTPRPMGRFCADVKMYLIEFMVSVLGFLRSSYLLSHCLVTYCLVMYFVALHEGLVAQAPFLNTCKHTIQIVTGGSAPSMPNVNCTFRVYGDHFWCREVSSRR